MKKMRSFDWIFNIQFRNKSHDFWSNFSDLSGPKDCKTCRSRKILVLQKGTKCESVSSRMNLPRYSREGALRIFSKWGGAEWQCQGAYRVCRHGVWACNDPVRDEFEHCLETEPFSVWLWQFDFSSHTFSQHGWQKMQFNVFERWLLQISSK